MRVVSVHVISRPAGERAVDHDEFPRGAAVAALRGAAQVSVVPGHLVVSRAQAGVVRQAAHDGGDAFANICTALELLCFLLGILSNDMILASFKPLQCGIAACMTCPNAKVIRSVHSLLSCLMSVFPTEPTSSQVSMTCPAHVLTGLRVVFQLYIMCALQNPVAINQSPSLREKAILLVKLMQQVECRFPDDQELNAQFLELVNNIYR